ncbi:MAG: cellulose synthase/poly-beta-1,6-N-acetylglucosamine synthase-like glycosyltransferase, partial [Cellvibrionaceae bacterium]
MLKTIAVYLIAILYFMVSAGLFVYGVHCFAMLWLGLRKRGEEHTPKPTQLTEWPPVTVQIPIYNEMYVAERIIKCVSEFDYPADKLQIQILDDSTDQTVSIISGLVDQLKHTGINIDHLIRTNRDGYKAGALKEAMPLATGEYLAIFDADFVPAPDYLKLMMPWFRPNVGFIQARWGHLNRTHSILTRIQSIFIDAHFTLEQVARSRSGLFWNFNGTAGIWRRAALESVGGWSADTLTEDLDLSYRTLMAGWEAVYVKDVEIPAELPVSAQGFRRQQHRWARGSLECAIKLLPTIWRLNIPVTRKLAATFHLTGYSIHFLILGLVILYPIILLLAPSNPWLIGLGGAAAVFALTSLVPTAFFIAGQIQANNKLNTRIFFILFLTTAGAGLMLNTLRAAIEIFTKKHAEFERTAKFGTLSKAQKKSLWMSQKYNLTADRLSYWEMLLGIFSISTSIY